MVDRTKWSSLARSIGESVISLLSLIVNDLYTAKSVIILSYRLFFPKQFYLQKYLIMGLHDDVMILILPECFEICYCFQGLQFSWTLTLESFATPLSWERNAFWQFQFMTSSCKSFAMLCYSNWSKNTRTNETLPDFSLHHGKVSHSSGNPKTGGGDLAH